MTEVAGVITGETPFMPTENGSGPSTLSLDQYLAPLGLAKPWLAEFALHRSSEHISPGQRRRQLAAFADQAEHYANRRADAIFAYGEEIAAGRIAKPSLTDQLRITANGHPDNASVQAARRILQKREAAGSKS